MADIFIPSAKLDRFQRKFNDNQFYFISLHLELDGYIDLNRLEKAIEKVADAVKILRCYYTGSYEDENSGWVLLTREPKWLSVASSDPASVTAVLDNLPTEHPPLHVTANQNESHCTLVFSIDHTVTDAHGLWDIVGMISTCYMNLAWDQDYTPAPVSDWNTRSMDPLLDSYSREACAAMCRIEAVKRIPVQQYQNFFQFPQEKRGKPQLFVEKIQPHTLNSMKEFARRNNATLNDVLVTVYAAALQEYVLEKFQTSMSMVPIRGAVDLRRYLPPYLRNEIKNYSVSYWSRAPIPKSGDIVSILREVTALSKMHRTTAPGIGELFAIEEPESEAAKPYLEPEYYSTPFMSNTGILPKDVVDFGNDISVIEAVNYANITTGNPFVIVVLTWNNTISFSIFTDGEYDTAQYLLKRMSELLCELN
ncbi:condensation domain-containing protein [uncultured Methanocorpusculum sp.]|nr:condensation domain-containing protein [uncultured Methanocorpusculum sp.]